jgi:hypothetical protein
VGFEDVMGLLRTEGLDSSHVIFREAGKMMGIIIMKIIIMLLGTVSLRIWIMGMIRVRISLQYHPSMGV